MNARVTTLLLAGACALPNRTPALAESQTLRGDIEGWKVCKDLRIDETDCPNISISNVRYHTELSPSDSEVLVRAIIKSFLETTKSCPLPAGRYEAGVTLVESHEVPPLWSAISEDYSRRIDGHFETIDLSCFTARTQKPRPPSNAFVELRISVPAVRPP